MQQYVSRFGCAVVLALSAACADSQPVTAPITLTSVSAEVTQTCEDELTAVESAIGGATFNVKNPVETKNDLLQKVTDARVKLTEGKPADAVQKLLDIRVSVVALSTAAKPRLDLATAGLITGAIDAAVGCIDIQSPVAPTL